MSEADQERVQTILEKGSLEPQYIELSSGEFSLIWKYVEFKSDITISYPIPDNIPEDCLYLIFNGRRFIISKKNAE
jgi:hypothetical protein